MQIIPITQLRDTNAVSELCHQSHEPIFLTKNGYGDLVMMSLETYKRTMAREEMRRKLAEAEASVAAGKVYDFDTVMAHLRKKYAAVI